jgi:hypothetical protein
MVLNGMSQDNFANSAEMFSNVRKMGWSRTPMKYRRFSNLALAVKFAVEDMDDDLHCVIIRTDNEDLTGAAIRKLYDSAAYPLERNERAVAHERP